VISDESKNYSPQKRYPLIAIIIVLGILALTLLSKRVTTIHEVSKIRALEGQAGKFEFLARSIHARYHTIEIPTELKTAFTKLNLSNSNGVKLIRFNGEGVPYFYGYVAYDTNRETVVKVVVDELW
jgi:hypothetical protein